MAQQHILPVRTYLLVFVALLGLTALTVAASFLPVGVLHVPIALAIAGVKAALVLLIFMHVWYSKRLILVVALSGLLWLAILIVFTMADYLTRA
jgi:cytochrome c oxidase subunit IV